MALSFNLWSRTAASNATADPAINMAEGMLPGAVNDGIRALMASAAGYRDDVAGAITTGGTATAFTVTSYQVFSSLAVMANQVIAFVPHATNTNAVGVDVTLNVDGLGAKSIRMQPSVALPNGTLVLGTPYIVVYNNSDAVFYLRSMTNPYSIPLGAGVDYWGTTAPNTSFAIPIGQAISRTTYATLFSLVSTTYGVGDGSSTFNLPDKRGRVSMQLDPSGAITTSATMTPNANTLGATGGGQVTTLLAANLPAYTPAGSPISAVAPQNNFATAAATEVISYQAGASNKNILASASVAASNSTASVSFTGTAQGGTSTAFTNLQPTIGCNYILRILTILLTLHMSIETLTTWTI